MTAQDELTKQQVAAFKRAFLDAIADIKNSATLAELQILIERDDVDGIMRLLGIDQSAFSGVVDELRESLKAGGAFAADVLSPIPTDIGSVAFRYDMTAASAVEWLQTRSSELIVEIVEDQRQLIRDHLAAGTEAGINPRTQAQGLIGQVNRATGGRQGGVIGLTSQQAGWMRRAAVEVEGLNSNYLTRELRDTRFDAAFKKARESGEAIPAKTKSAMLRALEENTLVYRSETIARTEAINALRAGQDDAIVQAIAKGDLGAQDVTKTWDATGDSRTRESHLLLEGDTVQFTGLFTTINGSRLAYPGDTTHGARGEDTIQCRCRILYRVDYLSKAMRGFA